MPQIELIDFYCNISTPMITFKTLKI